MERILPNDGFGEQVGSVAAAEPPEASAVAQMRFAH